MIYMIVEAGWLRSRFKVYELGHTEGDETWVATFRIRGDAVRFVKAIGGLVE